MIEIGNAIVSVDIFEKAFCCDLAVCRGMCCVEGDSGAPLEKAEYKYLKRNLHKLRKYMLSEGSEAVERQGAGLIDEDGDLVTPLINCGPCAYIIRENGLWWCAIEKAWSRGDFELRKPISCHLYPVRIKKYPDFEALNYNEWHICRAAVEKGGREGIPVYRFVKDALIRKYGTAWYEELEAVAAEIESGRLKLP